MSIQELLPEVQENVLLAQYTTFKIGGNAKYFFTAKKREEIIKAVKAAQQCDLSFFILANGSNVLFSDNGFDGLVIKLENTNNELRNDTIYAQAGVMLSSTVNIAEEAGLSGLEWAGGIPGTVGGAVRGNAGAFDSSVSDIVKSVEALDVSNLEIKNYKIEDCEFGYRNSIFKKNKNLIILSIEIELQKGDRIEIEKQIQEYKNYRKEHHPLKFSSAGSIFKNPSGLSVGELIEKSGLKGKIIGDAQISEKHCNFIVNLGRAEAKDVLALINLVKKEVKNKFDINIEEEIMIV